MWAPVNNVEPASTLTAEIQFAVSASSALSSKHDMTTPLLCHIHCQQRKCQNILWGRYYSHNARSVPKSIDAQLALGACLGDWIIWVAVCGIWGRLSPLTFPWPPPWLSNTNITAAKSNVLSYFIKKFLNDKHLTFLVLLKYQMFKNNLMQTQPILSWINNI